MIRKCREERPTTGRRRFHKHHATREAHFSPTERLGDLKRQQTDFAGFFKKLRQQSRCFGLNGLCLRPYFLRHEFSNRMHQEILFVRKILGRENSLGIGLTQ